MSDFENLLLKNPNLALSYTKFVSLKMKRIKINYLNLMYKDARSWLIGFLVDWAKKEGVMLGNQYTIENCLTQMDIAQIICTSRQTGTILLNEIQDLGLIRYDRKAVVIYDISKLV